MRITLDTDNNNIYVGKNFFNNIEKINAANRKMGAPAIDGIKLIQTSFEIAMADTDRYLRASK